MEILKSTVSVCMITYNHVQFIAQAIEGVLMQEADFVVELNIFDDASTDGTREVVDSYIRNHPRGGWINYTRQVENIGMMPNFICALNQCKGKYIALCEGDDFWIDSSKLVKQISFLEMHPKISLSFHDSNYLKNDEIYNSFSRKFTFLKNKHNYSTKELLKWKWFIPTASMVFRKIEIPAWMLRVNSGDSTLHLLLSKFGDFHFHNEIMSTYRIHSGGSSNLIRSHWKRLNDICLWFIYFPHARSLTLIRSFLSNFYRLIVSHVRN